MALELQVHFCINLNTSTCACTCTCTNPCTCTCTCTCTCACNKHIETFSFLANKLRVSCFFLRYMNKTNTTPTPTAQFPATKRTLSNTVQKTIHHIYPSGLHTYKNLLQLKHTEWQEAKQSNTRKQSNAKKQSNVRKAKQNRAEQSKVAQN